jgi:peptidyl-prolyl cis-trans isomerase A (cyclophilin A)
MGRIYIIHCIKHIGKIILNNHIVRNLSTAGATFFIAFPLFLSFLLTACGGGGGASTQITAPGAFTISSFSATVTAASSVTLSATAINGTGALQYCYKTDNTPPLASDACFQSGSQKSGVILTPAMTNFVFAKDSTGSITPGYRGPCSYAGYAASDASSKNTVCMMTSKGEIVIELEATKAPISSTNYLKYVNDGFYNATTFHRIISTFMIQGGGYNYDAVNGYVNKPSTYPAITLEKTATTGLSNTRGTIAMARTSVPDSATNEFYINVVDNTFLNSQLASDGNGYAVFGKVISGMENVDLIKEVAKNSSDFPLSPVLINWAYQIK